MTDKISNYSTTPASNNATSPDGWPEGMAPSGLNNSDREFAARVREFYEDPAWIDYGHTIVSSTSTTVSISGNVTGEYIVNRAIRAGQSESYVGYVTAAAYSAPNTSITCSGLDLTAVSQIELGGVKRGNVLPNAIVVNLSTSATVGGAVIASESYASTTAAAQVSTAVGALGINASTDYRLKVGSIVVGWGVIGPTTTTTTTYSVNVSATCGIVFDNVATVGIDIYRTTRSGGALSLADVPTLSALNTNSFTIDTSVGVSDFYYRWKAIGKGTLV